VIELLVFVIVLLAFVAIGLYLSRVRSAAPPRARTPAAPEAPAKPAGPEAPAAPPADAGTVPPVAVPGPAAAAPEIVPPQPETPVAAPEAPRPAAPGAGLGSRIRALFSGGTASKETWTGLEEALVRADVGPTAATAVVGRVRERYRPQMDPAEVVADEVVELFAGDPPWAPPAGPGGTPGIVMIVGVNGTGKTTTIGKMAARLTAEGRTVGMAASDTFRAAAGEQLGVWAERTGATLVAQERGADPGAVAFDAVKAAEARGLDVLFVDTAGRLHTRTPLMEELKKVRRVLEKAAGRPPDQVLLVLDATTGQNGIQQARSFTEAVDVSGLVLTKLDGTARGGIVLAVREELGIPVVLVGTGEGVGDLAPFDARAFARGLVS
jgi:fused signal recognition particle receptor